MMDLRSAFGFTATPFTREIAPEHHFRLSFLEEALDGLSRCIDGRMCAALIAPAGTGKTLLLRRLVAGLPEARYQVRYVKVTDLSKRDLCREIAVACGANPAGAYHTLVHRLQERFESRSHQDGVRPVLLLDEAHDLRPAVLPILRLLTNFEMDSRLVLSVVLSGQLPLKALLSRDEHEAVARRIYHYATLRLLTRDELGQYVAHRCAVAGVSTVPFDAGALDALFEMSRGNLRAADSLALKALEQAAAGTSAAAGPQHLIAARKELWP
jgi:general secretion pathway protein A